MKYYSTLFITLFTTIVFGQAGVISLMTLEADEYDKFYISYKVKEGETAELLSQMFSKSIEEISDYNEYDLRSIKKYSKVKVPFSTEMLSDVTESTNTAFVYVVQAKETLYTIGKKYFQVEIENIKKWNKLNDNEIGIGDALIVGYATLDKSPTVKASAKSTSTHKEQKKNIKSDIGLASTEEEVPTKELTTDQLLDLITESANDPLTSESESENETEMMNEEEYIAYTDQKGIAYTKAAGIENSEYFVLHPGAKVGTEMIISYPMLNTSVKAKVISTMPKELYPKNISVVISQGVAEALGAKDAQFRVEMKYISD